MKAIVLFSGGMDSTAVLDIVVKEYGAEEVLALNMFYGQRHVREIECARNIAEHYKVELREIDISQAFSNISSALLSASNIDIDDEQDKNVVGSTYVPGRNIIFLATAAGIADSLGVPEVYYGAHADDHSGYPDCTPKFVVAMAMAVSEGTKNKVEIIAPFVARHKADIARYGILNEVPLALTHSCYRGDYPACGTCPTCQLRLDAFKEIGETDPLIYALDTEAINV